MKKIFFMIILMCGVMGAGAQTLHSLIQVNNVDGDTTNVGNSIDILVPIIDTKWSVFALVNTGGGGFSELIINYTLLDVQGKDEDQLIPLHFGGVCG